MPKTQISKISEYRKKIDDIDAKLIGLIAERLKISKKIADQKLRGEMDIFQPQREKKALSDRLQLGTQKKLNKRFIEVLFGLIFKESRAIQSRQTAALTKSEKIDKITR